MNHLQITPYHFKGLIKEGISLDHVYLLSLLKSGENLSAFKTTKEKSLIQGLSRRLLITEDNKLTLEGERVFEFLNTPEPQDTALLKPVNQDEAFETFWKAYPSNDGIVIDNKVIFKPSRSLKGKKEEAHELFRQIMSENEYTLEQILKALKYEVTSKIELSVKLKVNKMTYMQMSSTWLRQRTFVQFVEVASLDSVKQTSSSTGAVDI